MPNTVDFTYRAIDKITPILKKIEKLTDRLLQKSRKLGNNLTASLSKASQSAGVANVRLRKTATHIDGIRRSADRAAISVNKLNTKLAVPPPIPRRGGGGKSGMPVGSGLPMTAGLPMMGGMRKVGLVSALVGGIMLNTGAKFEQSMADLGALTGMTSEQLVQFKKDSLDAARSQRVFASEVTRAVGLVGSQRAELLKTPKALLDVTKASILLKRASTSGLGLEQSAYAVTTMMNQFGMAAEKTGMIVNTLAAAEQAGSANAMWLNDSISRMGVAAVNANVSFKDTVTIMEILKNGIEEPARAGTNMRMILTQLEKQNNNNFKPSVVGIRKALENIAPIMKDTAAATKLVGAEAYIAAGFLSDNIGLWDTIRPALDNANKAMEMAADRENTVASNAKQLAININNLLIMAYSRLKPAISAVLAVAVKFTGWLIGTSTSASILRKVLGGAFIFIAGAIVMIGKAIIAAKISSFMTLLAGSVPIVYTAATAMGTLAASVWAATWPILAIVAAVAALTYGLYKLYKWVSGTGTDGDINVNTNMRKQMEMINTNRSQNTLNGQIDINAPKGVVAGTRSNYSGAHGDFGFSVVGAQ